MGQETGEGTAEWGRNLQSGAGNGAQQAAWEEVPLVHAGWFLLLKPVCFLTQRFPCCSSLGG